MTRERRVDVYIPIVPGGAAGLGGIGAMFATVGGVVLFAVLVCIAVSCAHFSDDTSSSTVATIPGPCQPFCPATTSAAVPGGAR